MSIQIETTTETSSIVTAELELRYVEGEKQPEGYWLRITHRGSSACRAVGPFGTRLAALDWLRRAYGGGA